LRKNNQPVSLAVGASINLSKALYAESDVEMSSGSDPTLRTGFEYEVLKNLMLRAGFITRNNSFCFGTGYRVGGVTLDIGFTTHEILGVTSVASLIFRIH